MRYTAFSDFDRIAAGSLSDVHAACLSRDGALIFDPETGRVVDIDPRFPPAPDTPRPGRPKLGVVPREVTLLPRHWDWLATQPGGASVALRKLVEEASRSPRPNSGPGATPPTASPRRWWAMRPAMKKPCGRSMPGIPRNSPPISRPGRRMCGPNWSA